MGKSIAKILITIAIVLSGVVAVYTIVMLAYVSQTLAITAVVFLILGCILGWFIYAILDRLK